MKKNKKILISLFMTFALLFTITLPVNADSVQKTIEEQQFIDEVTEKILAAENGELFIGYDYDDLEYVLDNDIEQANRIFEHYDKIAKAIPVEETNNNQTRSFSSAHFTASKDIETGAEDIKYENEFYDKTLSDIKSEPYVEDGTYSMSKSLTRSYADWKEFNPQNYSDTRTVFKLWAHVGGYVYTSTAFKINDKYLGTAGHCVFIRDADNNIEQWADRILCVPAWRPSEPYQPYGNRWASSMECGGNWRSNTDPADDWGVITLTSGISTGYMGMRNWGDNNNHNRETVRISGYAGDSGAMRLSWGYVTDTGRRLVTADYNSAGGMSGSPIIDKDGFIVGIHRDAGRRFVKFDNWIYNKMVSYR